MRCSHFQIVSTLASSAPEDAMEFWQKLGLEGSERCTGGRPFGPPPVQVTSALENWAEI